MVPPSYSQLWSPLRQPAFRRLWLGLVLSRLGDQFTSIALLWFVYDLTGSGTAIGLIILFFRLPGLVTGPLFGRLLDRRQARYVLSLDNFGRALLIAGIPLLYQFELLLVWHIYLLALLAGALSPATEVGIRTLIPDLIDRRELEQANALAALSWELAILAGPITAGMLTALLGAAWVLLFDAASFAIMGVVSLSLPLLSRTEAARGDAATARWLGFDQLLKLREVRAITLLSLVFFFAYGPLETALPVYSREVLQAGAAGYGSLWSAYAVGSVLSLLSIRYIIPYTRRRSGVTLALIAVLWGLLLLPLVLSSSLTLVLISLGLAGYTWAPYTVIETSMLQRLIPERMRGQVFGAHSTLVVAAAPLGAALGGVLLDYLSSPAVIAVSAVACLLIGVAGLLSPVFRTM